MATLETLKAWRDEAETAMHSLMIGERVVTVSIADRATTYTPSDMGRLESYINKLNNQIARLEGTARRGPLLMKF